jgi:putative tryptophan/tyrosine transport system substrate-binding protein
MAMLGLAAASFAQTDAKPYRIGYVVTGGAVSFPISVEPFKRGMRDLGYREGPDFVLELRAAEGRTERLPALVADLARQNVRVIVTSSTPGTHAAMRATKTIPIVFANAADPVASRLVKNLARPGGNVTGLSNIVADLGQKQLEILQPLLPALSKVGVLVNPANETNFLIAKDVQNAAKTLSIAIIPVEARDRAGIEAAFGMLSREGIQALIVALDPFFIQQRRQIAELATKGRIATMFGGSGHVEAGGLFSYGPDIADNFRRAASYVDRILKGAKPGDLPVEQPSKFELLINLRTAETIGIAIPRDLRARADRVIE